ncbi:hypothetical protein HanHA89_Chr11g0409291 [Helianthus annuus]|uniref:Putative O-methyltransferase, family 2 n=1 Tax=Helianthus annuus TaxID=4232 RepID=A0A251T8L7_HELAN|nr:hypothetical protein HanHA89_Chr11g0409291 [Helianthus annuus]
MRGRRTEKRLEAHSAPESTGVEHVGGSMFDHVPKADGVYMTVSLTLEFIT